MSANAARTVRACPCCATRNAGSVHINEMATIGGLDMSYRVVRCRCCGFLYADDLPSPESYRRYYGNLSKYDQVGSRSAIPEVDRLRSRAVLDLCRSHLRADAIIADLGCGVGQLLHEFDEAGWHELYGLDPAPDAARCARSLFGLRGVRCGLLADATALLPLARVDLVCLTGVLEHLWSPRGDLSSLLGGLPRGARVLIEVPALERFTKAPCEPFGEFSLEHIQYFSTATLGRLLGTFGFHPIESRLIDLPTGTTDSLLGIFERAHTSPPPVPSLSQEDDILDHYLALSEHGLEQVLARILASRADQLVIYGAGSHSARLLPRLVRLGLGPRITAVLDGNINLQGQRLGDWIIEDPQALRSYPDATVLISSFRAQSAIAQSLASAFPNDLLCLY